MFCKKEFESKERNKLSKSISKQCKDTEYPVNVYERPYLAAKVEVSALSFWRSRTVQDLVIANYT